MANVLHRALALLENHSLHAFQYANATVRVAATGFTPEDVGKVARQLDNDSFWVLTDHSPPTWSEITNTSVQTPRISGPFADLGRLEITIYVRTATGNDSNDGSSPASAFATLDRAFVAIEKDFFNGDYVIDITDCTFDENVVVGVPMYRSPKLIDPYGDVKPNGAVYCGAVNFRATPTALTGRVLLGDVYPLQTHATSTMLKGLKMAANPNWSPGEHAGHFMSLPDVGPQLYVVADNTADTLFFMEGCPVFSLAGFGNVDIQLFKPSAKFLLHNRHQFELITGSSTFTFSGIDFTGDFTYTDRGLAIFGSGAVLFENCLLGDAPWFDNVQRVEYGGSGVLMFSNCYVGPIRYTGGTIRIDACVSLVDRLFQSGYIYNMDSLVQPCPSVITVRNSYVRGLGDLRAEDFSVSVQMDSVGCDPVIPWYDFSAAYGAVAANTVYRLTNCEIPDDFIVPTNSAAWLMQLRRCGDIVVKPSARLIGPMGTPVLHGTGANKLVVGSLAPVDIATASSAADPNTLASYTKLY